MPSLDLNATHRRDRRVVLTGLAVITVLSWAYLMYLALRMSGMPMADMAMPDMAMPQWQPWGAVDFALMLLMWVVMMVAMMVPSASPMILTFTTIYKRQAQGNAVAPAAAFFAGYIIVWSVFSLVATLAQWGLHQAALLSPMMVSTSPVLGGTLLIAAGIFQWSRLKQACLSKCRTPLGFLLNEWRDGSAGALMMGLRHGLFCTGCCWALMVLLFVVGVMNLLWVAAIAAFVLVEKIAPQEWHVTRIAGLGLMTSGGWLLLHGSL